MLLRISVYYTGAGGAGFSSPPNSEDLIMTII